MEIGKVIENRYRILRVIGNGGMSVVYLAEDIRLNKQWAIKESRKMDSAKISAVITSSLITEAEMLKRLRHPALPQIVDIIDSDDSVAIVMEYVEGESLGALLQKEGPQSQEKVIDWALQLCDVLTYLHSQRPRPVIYRDMKPANVMLRPDGSIAILDLGIAREFKEFNTNDTTLLGTKGYAPPEQYCGQTDARSDIYALGMTMHHLLTGISPLLTTGETGSQYGVEVPKGLDRIIKKCTQPAAENRYQSCQELQDDLLKLRKTLTRQNKNKNQTQKSKESKTHLTIKTKQKKSGESRGCKKPLLVVAALVLVAVLGVVGFLMLGGQFEKANYEKLISASTNQPLYVKVTNYEEAIAISPYDTRAYMKLLEAYEDEGRFGRTESNRFRTVYNANKGGFDNTSVEVAELNYKVGMMYFNYYTKADGTYDFSERVQKALPFFAANYENPDIPTNFAEKSISDCYYQICLFYKKYILSSNTAEEATQGDFQRLFDTLTRAMTAVETAGVYDQLSLYNSVFMLIYDLRGSMASTMVDKEAVLNLFDTAYTKTAGLAVQNTQLQKLKQEIIDNYASYRADIENAYDAMSKSD